MMTAKPLLSTLGFLTLSVSGCVQEEHADGNVNSLNQECHFVPNPLCAGPDAMPPTWDPIVDDASPAALSQLAPTGTLRVGVYYGNATIGVCTPTDGQGCTPVFDPSFGVLSGTAVDLTCRLATRLTIPLEFSGYPTIPAFLEGWTAGTWEVGFATDPFAPIADSAISHAYIGNDNTFLVPASSSFQSVSDLDQPGVNIAVQFGNTPDQFMRDHFVNANLIELVTGNPANDIFALVKSGICDTDLCVTSGYCGQPIHASAGGRFGQTSFALTNPPPWPTSSEGGRVLAESLVLANLAPFIRPGNPDSLCYLADYIEAGRSSGLLQALIDRLPFQTIGMDPCASDDDCPSGEVCSAGIGRCGLAGSFGRSVPPAECGCH